MANVFKMNQKKTRSILSNGETVKTFLVINSLTFMEPEKLNPCQQHLPYDALATDITHATIL